MNTSQKIVAIALVLLVYYQYGNVATVNNRLISRVDYINRMEEQVGEQTLDQMVTESLILDEAVKTGAEIEQGLIDDEINKIDDQLQASGQSLDDALAAEGMSRADLEEQIRLQKLVEKMSGAAEIEVGQEEIDAFLLENKEMLPEDSSEEELKELAVGQLSGQAKNEAINNWLTTLKNGAKIYYR